jgi:hypothetical protein
MKNQQASYLREVSSAGVNGSEETQRAWNGPRFELDDGPIVNVSLGIRRTLSALVLTALVAVGGA